MILFLHILCLGCGEIEVTSDLEIQKCRIGTYKLQQQVLNEKPVFKHETKEEYLFYMKKGKGFWMVNKSLIFKFLVNYLIIYISNRNIKTETISLMLHSSDQR